MTQILAPDDHDSASEIRDKIGDLSGVELMFNQVLVAIYVRPNKTKSGLYLSDKTLDEDVYQGKAGLVLKLGPTAFVDDEDVKFKGEAVKEGEWIAFRPSDGWPISINKVPCRILQDVHCKVRVTDPSVVW